MTERFLLDTNVVSELARPSPDVRVVAFVAALDEVLVPSVVVYELDRGVRSLPSGKRRAALDRWLGAWLAPSVIVLPLDRAAALRASALAEAAARRGRTLSAQDLFVLAIAATHRLVVATRNVRDFEGHGVEVTNPFAA